MTCADKANFVQRALPIGQSGVFKFNDLPQGYPNYFLDYQEHYDADVRFTDRICSFSGEWSGNVFDFFSRRTTN